MAITRIINGVIKTSEFDQFEGALTGQEFVEIISNNKNYKLPISALGSNITTFYTAIVFKRINTQPATPTGGSYANPIPTGGWTEYIPSGTAALGASTRIFSEDGNPPQQLVGSTPSKMTDTETFDVEFSSIEENPGTPSTNPDNGSNVGDETTIGMATRNVINGVGGVWSIIKIKGNKGIDGRDGTDYEYIFKLTENNVEPTPRVDELEPVQQVDYIPTGGSDDPLDVTASNQYEGVAKRTRVNGVWGTFSRARVWAKYGEDGNGYEYIYKLTETNDAPIIPSEKDPSSPATVYTDDDWYPLGGTDNPQGVTSTYQFEGVAIRRGSTGTGGVFSSLSLHSRGGVDGKDGTDYEYIFIKTEFGDTPYDVSQIAAQQIDDYVPSGETYGNWSDNSLGPDNTLPLEGSAKREKKLGVGQQFYPPSIGARYGNDGNGVEYIYKITTTDVTPATPSSSEVDKSELSPANTFQDDDWFPTGGTDEPTGVDNTTRFEWVALRKKVNGSGLAFNAPTLGSSYGRDGNGIEYIYSRTTSDTAPTKPTSSSTKNSASPATTYQDDEGFPVGGTDDPTGVTSTYTYEGTCSRKKIAGVGGEFSNPSVFAHFGKDGRSVNIKGTVPLVADLPSTGNEINDAYIVLSDGHIYICTALPNTWADGGLFQGSDGISTFVVQLYKRSISVPTVPSTTLTYYFATNSLSGSLEGGTRSIPAPDGDKDCYTILATASSNTGSDEIPTGNGTTPEKYIPVLGNTAQIILYKRSATVPTVPSTTLTYDFYNKTLTGDLEGGSQTPPAKTENPLYVTAATIYSLTLEDTIPTGEGADPVIGTQDGEKGASGIDSRTVNLTATTYAFTYNTNNANPSPVNSLLTATVLNTEEIVYYEFIVGSTTVQNTTTATYTYTPNPSYLNMPEKVTVCIREGGNSGTVLARDTVTMIGIKNGVNGTDGKPAIFFSNSNESHGVPTTYDGTVLSYDNSGCDISVGEGATQLTVDQSLPYANSTFRVTTIANGVTVETVNSPTIVGGGKTLRFSNITSFTEDRGYINFLIEVKRSDGTVTTLTSTQTLWKSKQGADGTNNAQVILYKRSATVPSMPVGTFTYNFDTGILSGGTFNGGSQSFPADDGNPCWVIYASANDTSVTTLLAADNFTDPPIEGIKSGINTATLKIYQRKNSLPVKPTTDLIYTFSTKVLSGTLGDGSTTIPTSDGNPLYVSIAIAASRTNTDTINSGDGSEPSIEAKDGKNDEYIYTRTATKLPVPTVPATSETNYQNDDYSPSPGSDNPIGTTFDLPYEWVSKRTKIDGIGGSFSTPPVIRQQNSINSRTVYLYKRVSESPVPPAKPTVTLTYDFVEGTLTGDTAGGTLYIPADNKDVCYRIFAPALSETRYDTITPANWSDAEKYVSSGYNTAIVNLYKLSATTPSITGITAVCTYSFADQNLVVNSGTLDGGSYVMPTHDGNPMGLISAPAYAIGVSDTIAANEGSDPVKIHEDTIGPYRDYSGLYLSTNTYYGNNEAVSVVKYNNIYYQALTTAGEFSDILPTNTTKGKPMNSYNNVATGLLFAEEAYIENLGVRKLRTAESHKRITVDSNKFAAFDDGENLIASISGEELFSASSNTTFNVGLLYDNTITGNTTIKIAEFSITSPSNKIVIPEIAIQGTTANHGAYTLSLELIELNSGYKEKGGEAGLTGGAIPLPFYPIIEKTEQIRSLPIGNYEIQFICKTDSTTRMIAELKDGAKTGTIDYSTVFAVGSNGIQINKLDDSTVSFTGNFYYGGEGIMKAGEYGLKINKGGIYYTKQGDSYWQEAFT